MHTFISLCDSKCLSLRHDFCTAGVNQWAVATQQIHATLASSQLTVTAAFSSSLSLYNGGQSALPPPNLTKQEQKGTI